MSLPNRELTEQRGNSPDNGGKSKKVSIKNLRRTLDTHTSPSAEVIDPPRFDPDKAVRRKRRSRSEEKKTKRSQEETRFEYEFPDERSKRKRIDEVKQGAIDLQKTIRSVAVRNADIARQVLSGSSQPFTSSTKSYLRRVEKSQSKGKAGGKKSRKDRPSSTPRRSRSTRSTPPIRSNTLGTLFSRNNNEAEADARAKAPDNGAEQTSSDGQGQAAQTGGTGIVQPEEEAQQRAAEPKEKEKDPENSDNERSENDSDKESSRESDLDDRSRSGDSENSDEEDEQRDEGGGGGFDFDPDQPLRQRRNRRSGRSSSREYISDDEQSDDADSSPSRKGSEWNKIAKAIQFLNFSQTASVEVKTTAIAKVFTMIGDIHWQENRDRLFEMMAPDDRSALQFSLETVVNPACNVDLNTGVLSDIANVIVNRLLSEKSNKNQLTDGGKLTDEAVGKLVQTVIAFNPRQPTLLRASHLGKGTSGFKVDPLKSALANDAARRGSIIKKLITALEGRKSQLEVTGGDKNCANLLRSIEADKASMDKNNQPKDRDEHQRILVKMYENPIEYIDKKLQYLNLKTQEVIAEYDKYIGQTDSKKSDNDRSNQDRYGSTDKKGNKNRNRSNNREGSDDNSQRGSNRNSDDNSRDKSKQRRKSEKSADTDSNSNHNSDKLQCNSCGGIHRSLNSCTFRDNKHPETNWDKKLLWAQSTHGIAGANMSPPQYKLTFGKKLDGSDFEMKSKGRQQPKSDDKPDGKSVRFSSGNGDVQALLSHVKSLTKFASNLELVIPVTNRKGQRSETKVRGALIDTGAIDNTYIGRRLATRLVTRYGAVVKPNNTVIYTPDKGAKPFFSQGEVDFNVVIFNELTKEKETITLKGLVIDSPLDLIIGLPDIKKHGLLRKCEAQILNFGVDQAERMEVTTLQPVISPDNDTRLANECSRPPPSPLAHRATAVKRPATNDLKSSKEKVTKVDGVTTTHPATTTRPVPAKDGVTTTYPTTTTRPVPHRTKDLTRYKSSFAASMSSWSPSSSGSTTKGEYNCRACCTLVKPTKKVDPPNFGLGVPFNPTSSGMWHLEHGPTDDCVIEPELEGTFLCRQCIVTETSKRKRDETLRNHLEESAIVEDNEEEIQSYIAMLHSSVESEEGGTDKTQQPAIDPLCATPATHPWTGRLSLCGALSTQASQKKVNIHIDSLPADVLAKPIPMEKLLGQSPDLEYDPSAWLNNPDEDPEYATAEEILAAGEWEEATIKGTHQEIAKLRKIAHDRREVFSSKLPYLPARVTPLSFHVKEEEWQQSSNRLSPRRQSLAKDEAIEKMTRDLVERNVLSTSKATAWSQVHLQKKPAGSKDPWRYCIDFRRLNSSLANTGWPLPKIRDLLTRIGDAKPTHFGKFDLTNGYHQMPLAKESQAQTAFVTPSGLFEWKRVPMGIKQAAGYFQRVMQQVLGDLLYNGVELYIDDIIVYASSFEEYERLTKTVLERLSKVGIVVSPRKCYLGMSELEILGHTVNAKGVTFSKEKLQGVLDFPLPTTTTKLQSFLGLTTYFRDHVKDMTKLERPLRDMLKAKANKKHVQLTWDDDSHKAFKTLQHAVWNCATLFFYDNTLPVYLHTDACDTGIGAYLFQLDRDGKEQPIGFMSQALHDAQLRWSTFEQEAFAIHEALKKFQYLLRDVQFTLRTDHRNLLYLNDSGASDKVLRWKLDIQQFDFLVEHIPGEQNVVADLYSRLCSLRSHNLPHPDNGWMERNMELPVRREPTAAHWLARLEARNTVEKKPHTRDHSPMTAEHRTTIAKCHGGLCGHGGVERTLRLIKEQVPASEHWPNMRRDIREFIHTCPACQFMQPSKMLIATTAPYNMSVHSPMDRINIDTIGPLPEDADGNKYIIVIIDVFSRYAELYSTKDATAVEAAKCMVHWIGHYGIPGELLTDNGKQYTADVIEQLCELLQLDHLTIMPYSHQENAIVERANREVNRILRAIVFDLKVKKDWSLYLPLVGRVMNSMKHSAIGCAPANILFGNSVDLNRGLFPDKERVSLTKGEPLNEYLSKLLSIQGTIVEIAQKTQLETSAEHIQRKIVRGDKPYDLKVDDWVILEIPNTFTSLDNRPDKLSMHYKGPYLVKAIDGSEFSLKNVATNTVFTANQAHIHPFNYDSEQTDPAVVQRHLEQEFLVEEILNHRGKRKANKHYSRESFEVLVQWTGYSKDYNSWEPFESVKDTSKFHDYLVKNKLKYLLTAEAKRALADKA